jgi:beta-galactosidase
VLGVGFRESCLEDDFALGVSPPALGEAYLRAFERALFARGVPFAYAGGESLEASLLGASWVVAVLTGGVKASVLTQLRAARDGGAKVTIGPSVPDRDGSMRLLGTPHDARDLELDPLVNASRADALVARRIEELGLPAYPLDRHEAYLAVHEDAAGTPRVVFVMNPTAGELTVRASVDRASALVELLPELSRVRTTRIARVAGSFEVVVPARTVRMLGVEA